MRLMAYMLVATLMMALPQGAWAEEIPYLLTAETLNSKSAGTYTESSVTDDYKFTLSSGTEYTYEISSMPTNGFSFRIYVKGWGGNDQLKPTTNGQVITVDGDAISIGNDNYTTGDNESNTWKVNNTTSTIILHVDLSTDNRKVWITTKTNTDNDDDDNNRMGGDQTTAANSFYLVGNFFGPNKFMNDNGDGDNINYSRRIFQFTKTGDNTYSVDIPATIDAKVQILSVDPAGVEAAVYGPGPDVNNTEYGLQAFDGSHGGRPTTDGTATGTLTCREISSDETLNSDFEKTTSNTYNYWKMHTRNNNVGSNSGSDYGEDDGTYTFSFTLTNDVPTNWTVKHTSTRRTTYFLSTKEGSIAQALINVRTSGVGQEYNNVTYATIYIDPSYGYYAISNIVMSPDFVDGDNQNYSSVKRRLDTYSAHTHKHNRGIKPTTNKLFYMGNGNKAFSTSNPNNEVSPNEGPMLFTSESAGMFRVEYNPSNGHNDQAISNSTNSTYNVNGVDHLGMRGQIIGLQSTGIQTISMVGDAVAGTTNGDTWDYTSTAGDMTYDNTENCYKLTLNTSADDGATHFRFVANHSAQTTFAEEDNTTANGARTPYDIETSTTGHTALPSDPNNVSYYTTDNTSKTDINIIFNRPAGLWTVRFYITNNESDGSYIYHYTIDGAEKLKITLNQLRTYSNSIDLVPLDEKLHVYAAQKFSVENTEYDGESKTGKVMLYQLDYIPANVGVVLYYVDNSAQLVYDKNTTHTVDLVKASAKLGDNYKTYDDGTPKVTEVSSEKPMGEFCNIWTNSAKHSTETWNNDLVPTLEPTKIYANVYDKNGKRTARNFILSHFFSSTIYKALDEDKKASATDYYGFFRAKNGTNMRANMAYLQYDTKELTGNGQILGTDLDDNQTLAKGVQFWFDDLDEEFNTPTGINTVNSTVASKVADGKYYTLQGIAVSKPVSGIYIHNGKKVVIK